MELAPWPAPPAPASNPAAVYMLARSEGSRRSVGGSLRVLAGLLCGDGVPVASVPWERVDYARAISYLENVAAIRHANVIDIQGSEIIVRLVADGLLPQLEQAFALDKRLQPMLSGAYQGEYSVVLDYRWPNGENR